MQFSK